MVAMVLYTELNRLCMQILLVKHFDYQQLKLNYILLSAGMIVVVLKASTCNNGRRNFEDFLNIKQKSCMHFSDHFLKISKLFQRLVNKRFQKFANKEVQSCFNCIVCQHFSVHS